MNTYSEQRPWDWFEKFHQNKPCTVKLIYVNSGKRLSLQYHNKRSEFWKVVRGTAMVELDGKETILAEGDTIVIPRQARHRVGALDGDCTILEIAYGKFDEDDIVRIEDDFQRVAAKPKVPAAS